MTTAVVVRAILDATLTFVLADLDRHGAGRCRSSFDPGAEAGPHATHDVVGTRFIAFRVGTYDEAQVARSPPPSPMERGWKRRG